MQNSLPEAISAEHLTDVLCRCGALANHGRVNRVTVISTRDTILSRVIRVTLRYESESAPAPPSLIFKTVHPDRAELGWNAGRHEVAFYMDVASQMTSRLDPCCFEGHHDPELKSWHLLLEDLSDTHYIALPVLPPTIEQCRDIVRA